jgi:RNA:NAD 2'-phosphotransferase (TPT1/KptA family)
MAGVAKATLAAAILIEAPAAAPAVVAPSSSVRLTPNADYWKPPQGWEGVPAKAGQRLAESGERFSFSFNREVTHATWSKDQRSSDGKFVSTDRWRKIGRALNQMLRHDTWLRVNLQGFAWADDAIAILEKWGIPCSLSDLYFVVAKERGARFQVASLGDRPWDYYDAIIRCVQGHSGRIQTQMESRLAHRPILHALDTPLVFHATRSSVLKHILGNGVNAVGLLPGGSCTVCDSSTAPKASPGGRPASRFPPHWS